MSIVPRIFGRLRPSHHCESRAFSIQIEKYFHRITHQREQHMRLCMFIRRLESHDDTFPGSHSNTLKTLSSPSKLISTHLASPNVYCVFPDAAQVACVLRGGTESINDIATEMPYNYGREHDPKSIPESTHRTHDRIPSQETRERENKDKSHQHEQQARVKGQ